MPDPSYIYANEKLTLLDRENRPGKYPKHYFWHRKGKI